MAQLSTEYSPAYYSRFRCKAGACPDTCCGGWELPVDDETYDYYASLNNEFGEEFLNNIRLDEDGDRCLRLTDARCPFLTDDNLCRIHKTLGSAHTPAVCRQHPAFIEEFDGFTERSLSLSCPAANELIFATPLHEKLYPSPKEKPEDDYLRLLLKSRRELLFQLYRDKNVMDCLLDVINKGQATQKSFDEEDEDFLPLSVARLFTSEFMPGFTRDMLSESEILKPQWRELLQLVAGESAQQTLIEDYMKENAEDIRKALCYFVYRYFLKSINDCDPELESVFIVFGVLLCVNIAVKTQTPFREAARLYSKEIEHNPDNMDFIKENLFARLAPD